MSILIYLSFIYYRLEYIGISIANLSFLISCNVYKMKCTRCNWYLVFFQFMYQTYYKISSAAEQGTLSQLRNILKRRDVHGSESVTKNFRYLSLFWLQLNFSWCLLSLFRASVRLTLSVQNFSLYWNAQ